MYLLFRLLIWCSAFHVFTQLLASERGGSMSDSQTALIDTAHRCAMLLMDIIDDCLEFAKLEAGKVASEATLFEPRGLLDDITAALAPSAQRKGLDWHTDVDPDGPPAILADWTHARRVLVRALVCWR